MADLINLRTVRKQKARADKDAKASENRVLFGRSKAEKIKDAAQKTRAKKHIEGHKRTPDID